MSKNIKTMSAVVIVALLLLPFRGGVYAQGEIVQCETEDEKIQSEVLENPYGEYIQIKATAYCPCKKCCGKSDGITRSGRRAVEGLTVASNVYYGKGILLYDENMELIGVYECMDTGTDGLDIYMDSHQKALEFGVRHYYIQAIDAVG